MGNADTTTSTSEPLRNPAARYRTQRKHQTSDHYPLRVEIRTDYSEPCLKRKLTGD